MFCTPSASVIKSESDIGNNVTMLRQRFAVAHATGGRENRSTRRVLPHVTVLMSTCRCTSPIDHTDTTYEILAPQGDSP